MTRPVTRLEPHQAKTVREVALTSGTGTTADQLEAAGLGRLIVLPYRARLRLGDAPTRDIEHMNNRDLTASISAGLVIYRKEPPSCRECGRPVEPGHVVVFGYAPSRYNLWGRRSFLHYPSCPDVS